MTPNAATPPRVLHLDDGRLWRGGQHQVWLLMRELSRLGIEQRLVAFRGSPLAERAHSLGIEVEEMTLTGLGILSAPGRIAARARLFDANLIHAHTAHMHGFGLRAARVLGGRVRMLSTRRVDFPVAQGWFSRRKYLARDQHYIAISEGVRRVLIAGGVDPARIDVVPSGVPPIDPEAAMPRAVARRTFGIADGEIAIVNVGALTDHKGHRWLIDAAPRVIAAFPAAKFHILGEGELRGDLQRQIAEMGLTGSVVLHGFVADARLKLSGFDLYVSSSHLEGLGTAILDAMLAGLPVVAAAAGGVTDVVLDGETGRLAPPREAATLGTKIIQALKEPDASRQMTETARRRVAERFSARAMALGTLAVYRKLLAG